MTILESFQRRHQGSARLYQEAISTFPSGVTHDTRYLAPFPIFVERAAGSRKWDVDGNEFVDLVMGHGALFLGHAHPEITRAVLDQTPKGTHYGASHALELEWGRQVKRLLPSAEKVRFTSSGTEAVMMATRLARAYTGRDRLLKLDFHFHGWYDSVVGARFAESDMPRSAGIPATTLSNTLSVPQDIGLVSEKLAEGDVAAVIVEPTGGSWGTLPLREGFLADLREVTHRYQSLLIFDEVVTGFRVAPGGAQERYGVTPDVTTLAKILAGGLPGGAVAGKADIISLIEFRDDVDWNRENRVAHPGTFQANPLSAAAGVAMLSLIGDGRYHRHADGLVTRLVPALNEVLERRRARGCAYGLSSYFHVVLGEEVPRPEEGIEWPWRNDEAPPRMALPLVMALKRGMLNHGVDLMSGSGGFTSGVHTEADIDRTIEAFEATISELQGEGAL